MNVLNHQFPSQIIGEFVWLRKLKFEDARFVYNLRTSKVAQYLNCPPGYSIESQLKWQTSRPDTEVNYLILSNQLNNLLQLNEEVGMISIYDCDWENGVSNVGRLLLKEEYVHGGTPFGLESLLLCYQYVFEVMEFRKISGTINSKNKKVVSLQSYLGMVQEGYFKNHVLLNGEPQDLYFFSLFKEDFPNYRANIDILLNKFRHIKTGVFQG